MAIDPFVAENAPRLGGWDPDPSTWGPIYAGAAKEYNVPESLLRAQNQVESGERSMVDGPPTPYGTAQGSSQFLPTTLQKVAPGANPYNPKQSIPAQAKLMRQLYDGPAGKNWVTALRMYQGGPNHKIWGDATEAYPHLVAAKLKGLGVDPGEYGLADIPSISGGVSTGEPQAQVTFTAGAPAGGAAQPASSTPSGAPPGEDPFITETLAPVRAAAAAKAAQAKAAVPAGAPQFGQNPLALGTPSVNESGPSPTGAKPSAPAPAAGVGPGPALPPTDPLSEHPYTSLPQGMWGPGHEAVYGALMRHSPYAAVDTAVEVGNRLLNGAPVGQTLGDVGRMYNYYTSQEAAQRQDYENQHPVAATAAQAGGMLGGTLAGERLVGAGLNLGARALETAAPVVAPAVRGVERFLSGTAGVGQKGAAGLGTRLASRAAAGAGQGATDALIQSPASNAPVGQQVKQGAEIGGALGSVWKPFVEGPVQAAWNRVEPNVARIANNLISAGVQLRPGQVASGVVRKLESFVGAGAKEEQLNALTKAVMQTVGSSADRLTKETWKDAYDAVASKLTQTALHVAVVPDRQFVRDLRNIGLEIQHTPMSDTQTRALTGELNNLLNYWSRHTITGTDYNALVNSSSRLSQMARGRDGILKRFSGNMLSTLNDLLERKAPPAEVSAIREARNQFRNLFQLRDLVRKNPSGLVDPAKLASVKNAGPDLNKLVEGAPLISSRPAPQGGAKEPMSIGKAAAKGALVVPDAVIWATHPAAMVGTMGAAAATAGSLAGMRRIAQSAKMTNRLLDRSRPPTVYNPLIPLGVTAGNLP